MYKFLIPLFALALLIGCTPKTGSQTDGYTTSSSGNSAAMTTSSKAMQNTSTPGNNETGFDGKLITGKHTVVIHTTKGDITIELDADAAPKAATNFYVLSKIGFYNGLIFHRVIPNFMIQGGDPNGNGTGGESVFGATFEDEPNNIQMVRGVIAMANRGPNTNGSQFFIVQAPDASWLQGKHTIFGRVTAGMDVVDAIANAKRDQNDKPTTAITMQMEVKD